MKRVIALLMSDLHLSLTQPIARDEPDWMEAQERILKQVRVQQELGDVPVICAGDLFDRWNAPAELINWAIDHLPNKCYAIPGQHDLPLHNSEDIHKSAYWTLVKAGAIRNLYGGPIDVCEEHFLYAWGFGWGTEVVDQPSSSTRRNVTVAVVHRYCWTTGKCYPTAPAENRVNKYAEALKGYDAAVFGDNHIPFLARAGDCNVLNCGCLIPRRSDERRIKPGIGLLYEDGTMSRRELDCSEDRWKDEEELVAALDIDDGKVAEFLNELRSAEGSSLSYRDAVVRYINDNEVDAKVKSLVLELLDRRNER